MTMPNGKYLCMKALQRRGAMKVGDLQEATGWSRSSIYRFLGEAKDSGMVTSNEGWWSLTADGRWRMEQG